MMTNQEQLTMIALASKAALLAENDGLIPSNDMERIQFVAAAEQVRPILARLDADWPGLIPVPHDGRGWKMRDSS
jgi:hypothetical protein